MPPRLQFDLDARLLARLLDDGLRLLPGRIDSRSGTRTSALCLLGANAVRALFPAAASRIALLSRCLNSSLVFFDARAPGRLRKFAVAERVRP